MRLLIMVFRCSKCYRSEEYDTAEEAFEAGWKMDIEGRWKCPNESEMSEKDLAF